MFMLERHLFCLCNMWTDNSAYTSLKYFNQAWAEAVHSDSFLKEIVHP